MMDLGHRLPPIGLGGGTTPSSFAVPAATANDHRKVEQRPREVEKNHQELSRALKSLARQHDESEIGKARVVLHPRRDRERPPLDKSSNSVWSSVSKIVGDPISKLFGYLKPRTDQNGSELQKRFLGPSSGGGHRQSKKYKKYKILYVEPWKSVVPPASSSSAWRRPPLPLSSAARRHKNAAYVQQQLQKMNFLSGAGAQRVALQISRAKKRKRLRSNLKKLRKQWSVMRESNNLPADDQLGQLDLSEIRNLLPDYDVEEYEALLSELRRSKEQEQEEEDYKEEEEEEEEKEKEKKKKKEVDHTSTGR